MTNISKHPLLKDAYEVCRAIEECGASPALTNAVAKAGDVMHGIDLLVDQINGLKVAHSDVCADRDRWQKRATELLNRA
jgi:hypothetical protein